jgi:hypothetical protein
VKNGLLRFTRNDGVSPMQIWIASQLALLAMTSLTSRRNFK